ncbi:MAG: AraC family transcriptional regulator, partial [Devosia sp.]
PDLDTIDAAPVTHATLQILAAVLRAVRMKLGQPASSAVLARAKRYIALNMAADLSLATLCAELGTTRSTLSRAFAPLGGVAAFVQARRLARVHAVLSRPDEHRTIAEIAHGVGFSGIASFYRIFHKTYGYTAGALRAQIALPQVAAELAGDTNEKYLSWDQRLR